MVHRTLMKLVGCTMYSAFKFFLYLRREQERTSEQHTPHPRLSTREALTLTLSLRTFALSTEPTLTQSREGRSGPLSTGTPTCLRPFPVCKSRAPLTGAGPWGSRAALGGSPGQAAE